MLSFYLIQLTLAFIWFCLGLWLHDRSRSWRGAWVPYRPSFKTALVFSGPFGWFVLVIAWGCQGARWVTKTVAA